MNLLVTGGCGFLGANVAAQAMRDGYAVTLVDNLSRRGAAENLAWLRSGGMPAFIHADTASTGAIDEAVRSVRPDAVVHLAGQVAMTTSIKDPVLDFQTNAFGTLNVLEAVRRHCDNACVIYSSTNKVYGSMDGVRYEETAKRYITPDHPNGFDETMPLEFQSPYGCSKGAADQYMLDYHRTYGLRTTVFRHSSIYGGRQYATADQGWIGWFCMEALRQAAGDRRPIQISGNGKQVRDVLHASDLQALYMRAIKEGRSAGQAYNIGGGMANSLSLLELFQMLESLVGVRLDWSAGPARLGDQKVFVANTERVSLDFGWVPQIPPAQGLQSMVSWVRETST